MNEETRNPIYEGQYEGESQAQAEARRHWARVGMQLARAVASHGGAERCDTCGTVTVRLDGDGCAKWCCKCGAKLAGTYVNVPAEAYPHGSPLHKEVFLALSSYNGSDTFEDGVRALIAELKEVRAELAACIATLPGTLYMDPPDGGDVSVPEQLARMAADAAKWRECEAVRQRVLNVWELPPADGDLPGVKPRREILDLAIAQGAILTGKPDGSESIQLIFSILAWRSFDAALLKVNDEAND